MVLIFKVTDSAGNYTLCLIIVITTLVSVRTISLLRIEKC
jgi:hypothetical protein